MNDVKDGAKQTPQHIVELRMALSDTITRFVDGPDASFMPGDATIAVLQLAAVMAYSLGGDRKTNIDWAAKNFFSAFGELVSVDFELSSTEVPSGVQ